MESHYHQYSLNSSNSKPNLEIPIIGPLSGGWIEPKSEERVTTNTGEIFLRPNSKFQRFGNINKQIDNIVYSSPSLRHRIDANTQFKFDKTNHNFVENRDWLTHDVLNDLVIESFDNEEFTYPPGNILASSGTTLYYVGGPFMNILHSMNIKDPKNIKSIEFSLPIHQISINFAQNALALRFTATVQIVCLVKWKVLNKLQYKGVFVLHVAWGQNEFFPGLTVFLDTKEIKLYLNHLETECETIPVSKYHVSLTSTLETFRGVYSRDLYFVDQQGVHRRDMRMKATSCIYSSSLVETIAKDPIHPFEFVFSNPTSVILFDSRNPNRPVVTQECLGSSKIHEIIIQTLGDRRIPICYSDSEAFHWSYFDNVRRSDLVDYNFTRASMMTHVEVFSKVGLSRGGAKRNLNGMATIVQENDVLLFQSSDIGDLFCQSFTKGRDSEIQLGFPSESNEMFDTSAYCKEIDIALGGRMSDQPYLGYDVHNSADLIRHIKEMHYVEKRTEETEISSEKEIIAFLKILQPRFM